MMTQQKNELVVEPTHLKNMIVKLDHFPKFRGENKKYSKPQPRKCPTKFFSIDKVGPKPCFFQ